MLYDVIVICTYFGMYGNRRPIREPIRCIGGFSFHVHRGVGNHHPLGKSCCRKRLDKMRVKDKQARGCHLSHYAVITDQNFAVKGCPFQHRLCPARDVKRVSISLFFEKKGTFFIMAMSVFWVPILKNRLGSPAWLILVSMCLQSLRVISWFHI